MRNKQKKYLFVAIYRPPAKDEKERGCSYGKFLRHLAAFKPVKQNAGRQSLL